MPRVTRRQGWPPAALAFWLLLGAAAPAASRELVIQRFDVELAVDPHARLEVVESIRLRFTGAWNGVIRSIPVSYRTPQGFHHDLELVLLGVTDEHGTSLKVEKRRVGSNRELKIYVPGATDAVRTVVLRYRASNAIRFFERHDELYWNVTGDEWEMPIEAASARITLPVGVSGVRALAFTGPYGSQEQRAEVRIDGREVRVQALRPLGFREGLTAVIGWDKGHVREPGSAGRIVRFLRGNWPFLLPVAVFALMFRLWLTRGRDPRLNPIAARYEPPEDLRPAEAGTLLDGSPDLRDVTATVVDLAVRGFLKIEEKDEPGPLGLWSTTEYVFRRQQAPAEWTGLRAHERRLLEALFAGGRESVELSDLHNSFYRSLPGIKDALFEQLMERRYYDSRPDKVKRGFVVAGIVVAFLSIHAGAFLGGFLGMPGLPIGLAMFLSGAILAGFGLIMPARTVAGTRALEGVLGFEEFLGRVEGDRFDRMPRTPELFERYLPFAMAFGVERRWVRAFEDLEREPPNWYRGSSPGSFRTGQLLSGLDRMSSRTATAMSSSPRGSGGSGFGGGSSGGGSGGGGGRGF